MGELDYSQIWKISSTSSELAVVLVSRVEAAQRKVMDGMSSVLPDKSTIDHVSANLQHEGIVSAEGISTVLLYY